LGRVSRFVQRTAFRRGVLGTSRGWFAFWAALTLVRFVRKRLGREAEVLGRVELGPGQGVVVTDTAVPWKALRG
jgi:hypothetical protein